MTNENALFSCWSIAELELLSNNNWFLTLDEWKNKMRFLQGPHIGYVTQEWEDWKPVWDKKFYSQEQIDEVKKDKNARMVLTYLVYSYEKKQVLIWEITQKDVIKWIKDLNSMWPNLSVADILVNKTKKEWTKFFDYNIITGQQKAFDIENLQEILNEVKEKWLLKRIEEARTSVIELQEKEIAAEIAAKKNVWGPVTNAEAEAVFA